MGSTVVVFPGQGSQKIGMGVDFADAFEPARRVYEEASEALSLDLRGLCGDADRIGLTEFTQPAILTCEIAMLRAVQAEYGLEASAWGGHSLGEYTALVAAGALSLSDAVRVVRERGRRMQAAVPAGEGAMAAIIREELDLEAIESALDGLVADVANHNAPNQVVISGSAGDVAAGVERLRDHPAGRGGRFQMLDVSAPFHSRLMEPIEPGFRDVLLGAQWASGSERVVSNYTGRFHEPGAVVDNLVRQISGTVLWVDDMRTLAGTRPERIIEIGPNRPLRGFFRAIGLDVEAVFNPVTARRVLGER